MSRSVRRGSVWTIKYIIIIILVIKVYLTDCIDWKKVRCSADPQQSLPDGYVPDIGRFPWLGVIQHSLNVGGVQRYLITASILVHPAFAIASADDISKIPYKTLEGSTKLILWNSKKYQYAINIQSYVLHPEYEDGITLASLALLQLLTQGETGVGGNLHPVLPICVPTRGAGSFTEIYAVKMTDARKELEKEALKMSYVDEKDCLTFYTKNKLLYKQTSPVASTCAVSEKEMPPCVWDAGVALITRQSWGYWNLLGFSVRGPGCGAPARFLDIFDYLPWINDLVTPVTAEQMYLHRIGVRRLSPYKIQIYNAEKKINPSTGFCHRGVRGNVVYKDSFEVTANTNFAQGFFFLEINEVADFTCAEVNILSCTAKSNVAVWIEHYCHKEVSGSLPGSDKAAKNYEYKKLQCFLYFRSSIFLEFRFYFSFRAEADVTVFGKAQRNATTPSVFLRDWTTYSWWPTQKWFRWTSFWPYYMYWWQPMD